MKRSLLALSTLAALACLSGLCANRAEAQVGLGHITPYRFAGHVTLDGGDIGSYGGTIYQNLPIKDPAGIVNTHLFIDYRQGVNDWEGRKLIGLGGGTRLTGQSSFYYGADFAFYYGEKEETDSDGNTDKDTFFAQGGRAYIGTSLGPFLFLEGGYFWDSKSLMKGLTATVGLTF